MQDAHEAIRPTDVTLTPERVKPFLSSDQFKLYDLIWRRFVAAFMAPAVFDTLRVDIAAAAFLFRTNGTTLKFPGFYAVWPREQEGDDTASARARATRLICTRSRQSSTSPSHPPRFTEASLIKDLEERGIGRPSTFVSIVSTIQDRGYVEQQERRFVPTWLGETVNELMLKHFPEIVDTNFTADMERRLDGVEEGKQGWTEFLKDFYTALRGQLERAEAEMDRVQKPVEEANEACPHCGKPLLIRSGRFGRFISCSGYPDCDFKKPLVAKTGALCPKDGGDLVERRAKRTGKVFYGCANYPGLRLRRLGSPADDALPRVRRAADAGQRQDRGALRRVWRAGRWRRRRVRRRWSATAPPRRSARAARLTPRRLARRRRLAKRTARKTATARKATTARKTTRRARKTSHHHTRDSRADAAVTPRREAEFALLVNS